MPARIGNISKDSQIRHNYLIREQMHLTALLMFLGLRHGLTPQQIIELPDKVEKEVPSWRKKSSSARK
jgi:hypothetical protein